MNSETMPQPDVFKKFAITEKLFNIFICFLTYSFTGWLIETIYMSIYHGYLTKRGFLIAPFCAVYGISSIVVVVILNHLKTHPFLLFVCAAALTSLVELFAGLFLNFLNFKRLWDYSGNSINFMGFICLRNSIVWGILSLFLVYFLHPLILRIVNSIPLKAKEMICFSAVIWLSLDISISIYTSLKGVNNLAWISQVFMHRMP